MEEIEEQALKNATTPPKSWYRYVDDCYSLIKKNAVHSFHQTLNSVDPDISFTVEHESNEQLPFLDSLTIRRNNMIHVTVYRKPTHTDRYLDFNSHHDIRHKISTAKTLFHCAISLPTTDEDRTRELNHISKTLETNGYPKKLISTVRNMKTINKTPTPEELMKEFFDLIEPSEKPTGFAVLPYIRGLTEPLTRILNKYDITVTNKALRTLQQQFPSQKFRVSPEQETNVVYQILCADCGWNYIGETGRSFETRKKEHIRNTKKCDKNSNIAKHAWSNSHEIDFEKGIIIDKGKNRIRKTLEVWRTALIDGADNNAKNLPQQYSILLHKQ